jgi:hypothetical protein
MLKGWSEFISQIQLVGSPQIDAGDPHVRFGGRGYRSQSTLPPYPYHLLRKKKDCRVQAWLSSAMALNECQRKCALITRCMAVRLCRTGVRRRRRGVRIGVAIAADTANGLHALHPAAEGAGVSKAIRAILGTPRPIRRRICRVGLDHRDGCYCQRSEGHSCQHRFLLLGRVRFGFRLNATEWLTHEIEMNIGLVCEDRKAYPDTGKRRRAGELHHDAVSHQ